MDKKLYKINYLNKYEIVQVIFATLDESVVNFITWLKDNDIVDNEQLEIEPAKKIEIIDFKKKLLTKQSKCIII